MADFGWKEIGPGGESGAGASSLSLSRLPVEAAQPATLVASAATDGSSISIS